MTQTIKWIVHMNIKIIDVVATKNSLNERTVKIIHEQDLVQNHSKELMSLVNKKSLQSKVSRLPVNLKSTPNKSIFDITFKI